VRIAPHELFDAQTSLRGLHRQPSHDEAGELVVVAHERLQRHLVDRHELRQAHRVVQRELEDPPADAVAELSPRLLEGIVIDERLPTGGGVQPSESITARAKNAQSGRMSSARSVRSIRCR
jgi:L-2-hydroxyglutarate oxidase LhgO